MHRLSNVAFSVRLPTHGSIRPADSATGALFFRQWTVLAGPCGVIKRAPSSPWCWNSPMLPEPLTYRPERLNFRPNTRPSFIMVSPGSAGAVPRSWRMEPT